MVIRYRGRDDRMQRAGGEMLLTVRPRCVQKKEALPLNEMGSRRRPYGCSEDCPGLEPAWRLCSNGGEKESRSSEGNGSKSWARKNSGCKHSPKDDRPARGDKIRKGKK